MGLPAALKQRQYRERQRDGVSLLRITIRDREGLVAGFKNAGRMSLLCDDTDDELIAAIERELDEIAERANQ